jgi:hypothetical protein
MTYLVLKEFFAGLPIISEILVKRNLIKKNKLLKLEYTELKQYHISKMQVLLNRDLMLKYFPVNSIIAEIGVDEGDFTKRIIDTCAPKKMHLIDSWSSTRYPEKKYNFVRDRFSKEISKNIIELNRGFSTTILENFPDNYFDWVYLDTDHGFEITYSELLILHKKIKSGGIIAGHDYCRYSSNGKSRFGVVEAVNKFCVLNQYYFKYITMETHRHLSFAIIKDEN